MAYAEVARRPDGKFVVWALLPDMAYPYNQKIKSGAYKGMAYILTWQAVGVLPDRTAAENCRRYFRRDVKL